MKYKCNYSDFHPELVTLVESTFPNVKSGLQGDSWVWIFEGNDKVAIDTFTSMKHQVKCESPHNQLINKVISVLSKTYNLHEYENPELEAHEGN